MGFLSAITGFFKKRGGQERAEDVDYSTLGLKSPSIGRPEDLRDMPSPPSVVDTLERDLPPIRPPQQQHSAESVAQDNTRAKIDLMMAQIDSIKIQSESINERLAQVEKMVRQLVEAVRQHPY